MLERFKAAPLPSSFMLISIIGVIISLLYIWEVNKSFGFAFALVFGAMFVASLLSMQKAPIAETLAIDKRK